MSEGTLEDVLADGRFRRGFDPRRGSTRTHGMSKTPTHRAWCGMIQRCTNPRNEKWPQYGGRGISVCIAWRQSFEAFLSDMGVKPMGASLDRINVNGDYEPGNCRWATSKQQSRNRTVTRWLTLDGVTASVADWAEQTGIRSSTILMRLRRGWSAARALRSPPREIS